MSTAKLAILRLPTHVLAALPLLSCEPVQSRAAHAWMSKQLQQTLMQRVADARQRAQGLRTTARSPAVSEAEVRAPPVAV